MTVGISDYSSHTPGAVTLPAAGGSYVDPVFGSTVFRITDGTMGTHNIHYYYSAPVWNADMTRMLVGLDGLASLFSFNRATGASAYQRAVNSGGAVSIVHEGAQWDRDLPNILYALETSGSKLWMIDVSVPGPTGYTLLKDFTSLGGQPWELSCSDSAMWFCFQLQTAGVTTKVVAWDRRRDVTYTIVPSGAAAGLVIHAAFIDKAGRNVRITFNDPGAQIWNWNAEAGTPAELFLTTDSTWDGLGHHDLGFSLYVNGSGYLDGIIVRRPDAQYGARPILHYYKADGATLNWTIADHQSIRCDDESHILNSTYGAIDATWPPFQHEIMRVQTDGSGFLRLAHSRSTGTGATGGYDYFTQPRAVISADSKWAAWTSDVGTNSARHDVLVLQMPAAAGGGGPPPPPPPVLISGLTATRANMIGARHDREQIIIPAGGSPNYQYRVSTALTALRGAVSQCGLVIVPFGPAPGAVGAAVVVTDQNGIVPTSIVHAELALLATKDHSVDDHLNSGLRVRAGNIDPAGKTFTIYVISPDGTLVTGQWSIVWSWS